MNPQNAKVKKTLLGKYEVTYDCPSCGQNLKNSLDDAGIQDSCPHCEEVFTVPGLSFKQKMEKEAADQAEAKRLAEEQKEAEKKAKEAEKKVKQAENKAKEDEIAAKQAENNPPSTPKPKPLPNHERPLNDHKLLIEARIVIILLVALLMAQLFGLTSTKTSTTTWEYVLESPTDAEFDRELRRLGSEGWELIFARRATSDFSGPSYEMILKRPKKL